jgi:uncharacterized cupredoxin-like copper-binding protein
VQQQRTRTLPMLAAALLALAAVGVIAVLLIPGSGGDGKNASAPRSAAAPRSIRVRLTDFKITPSSARASAGKVTFTAANAGDEPHEMVVVRTDKPAGGLLDGKEASEAGSVGEIGDFAAGKTKTASFDLKPGRYVLLCNLPGHYTAGMRTSLVVR